MHVTYSSYFNLFILVSRLVSRCTKVPWKRGEELKRKKKDVWRNVICQDWVYLWEHWTLGD